MQTIELTTRFRRDYKREKRGRYQESLDQEFRDVVQLLANDRALPARFRDHPLTGALHDCRDCHLKPDLVLLYRKPDDSTLQLVRLGSHSELDL